MTTERRLLEQARWRIANLSRAPVPMDDPLDGPVLRAIDDHLSKPEAAAHPFTINAACAEIASLRDSMAGLQHAAEEIERALCAQVCIDLGRDECAEAILARGKGDAIVASTTATEAPEEPDAADIIAGALQTSRSHAYKLMQDALSARGTGPTDTHDEPERCRTCAWSGAVHRSATRPLRTTLASKRKT